ncbi:asparagine synthetase B family protein [Sphingomonas psychrolutea]|uniref:asparagine synthase (glutamine-hydrolyzing) n=1 Tax=Sphingomonas psychrolutea TaxID=1259676 RepID=A0ABQ1H3Y7_9SPHN|nr:asparagine synthase-related protein [Sphingomonas psychrolutea]GGA56975.1 asparagine synthetase B [Sphingomonas psychrolutea]
MSGIAGVVYGDGRDVSPALLEQVSTASAIRADDGVAHWAGGSAGLIRFRHATTPEALGERQPSPAASGNVIAFDGRLDNREELIAMLGRDGAALRQRPDEEIALALFERIGDGFMRHLAGDYAFAIWQPDQRRLFCARAPVGRRPFFYHLSADGFAFASEPKALIVGLSLDRGVNEPLIAEYLARRVVTRGETFWRALNTLPQGSALAYQDGALRQWHWDDAPPEDLSRLSEGAHIERFNELLDQAIIACTRSNTGVVAQLSGGLDSSSILSRATELHRAGKIDRHVAAITARYPGSPVDESEWSGAVEAHLGITARVVQGSIFDPDAARAWSANTLQMPLRPNTLDTLEGNFRNLERHGERVLLSGEGGDELLNGNHAHWPDEIRRGRIDLVARQALAMPGATLPGKVRAFVSEGFGPLVSTTLYRRAALRQSWAGTALPDHLSPAWIEATGLRARIAASRPAATLPGIAAQNRYAVIDLESREIATGPLQALPNAYGVEYRHPLYDQRLLRFILGASGEVLFRNGARRHLFREAMRGTLVEKVRTRQSKAIFNTLVVDGLERFYAQREIAAQWPVKLGWVDGAALQRIWNAYLAWRDDGAHFPVPRIEFGALWSTAALDIWLENAVGL